MDKASLRVWWDRVTAFGTVIGLLNALTGIGVVSLVGTMIGALFDLSWKVLVPAIILGGGCLLAGLLAWFDDRRHRTVPTPQNQVGREKDAKDAVSPPPQAPPPTFSSIETATVAYMQERGVAHMWEYRYLGNVLVYGTEALLDWLDGIPGGQATWDLFHAVWSHVIGSQEEQMARIGVLARHNLILLTSTGLEITGKGREYRSWRGQLPALPPQAPPAPPSSSTPDPRLPSSGPAPA